MDQIAWSEKCYSVKDLYENLRSVFPLIIKTIQGVYAPPNIVFPSDQVLRIHNVLFQQKALCVDSLRRHVTIPRDCNSILDVIDGNDKVISDPDRPETIDQVLQKYHLPVKVRFRSDQICYVCAQAVYSGINNDHVLEIHGFFEDFYFVGNAINDGWIDKKIAVLPSFVNIVANIAEGFRTHPKTIWHEFEAMFTRTVRGYPFQSHLGCDVVVIYDEPLRPASTTMPRQPNNNSLHLSPANSGPASGEHIYVRHISIEDSQEAPPTLPPKQRDQRLSVRTPTSDIEMESRGVGSAEDRVVEITNSYSKWTAKVRPRIKTPVKSMADAQMQTTFSKGTARNPYNFKRLSEVPVDVCGLSVDEVSQCLRLLHLANLVERFQENQVDGILLKTLNETILHDEFGCTNFNARKIMRFVNDSWRPKVHL